MPLPNRLPHILTHSHWVPSCEICGNNGFFYSGHSFCNVHCKLYKLKKLRKDKLNEIYKIDTKSYM